MTRFVQCQDEMYYLDPKWFSDTNYLLVNEISYKQYERSSHASARKQMIQFLKDKKIEAKVAPLEDGTVRTIWPDGSIVYCYFAKIHFLKPPPIPDSFLQVMSGVSVEDFEFAWSYNFPTEHVWKLLHGDLNINLVSFLMDRRIYGPELLKCKRKAINIIRKQYPTMKLLTYEQVLQNYGDYVKVRKP